MSSQLWELSIIPMITVIFQFILITVASPMLYSLDSRKLPLFKSLFRYFFQGVFFILVITYILVQLKLYEFFSLFAMFYFMYLLASKARRKYNKRDMGAAKDMQLTSLLDLADREIQIKTVLEAMGIRIRSRIAAASKWVNPDTGMIFLIFAAAIGIRFAARVLNPLAMAGMADPYVHLAWGKMILLNKLFTDGIYPMGFHAIIASLGRLSNTDIYHVVSFLGPIGSSILIIGLYWFLKEITGKRLVALVGLVAFAFSTYNGLPVVFFRQTLSLPMEFSIAFILPGLIFLHDYIKNGDSNDLIIWGLSVVDVVMIHSYGALFYAIAAAALLVSGAVNQSLNFKKLMLIGAAGLGGGVLGMLPIIIAMVQGIKWHVMSTSWISGNVKTVGLGELIGGFSSDLLQLPLYVLFFAGLVFAGLLSIAVINFLHRKEEKKLWEAMSILLILVMLVLSFGPDHGFSLLDPTRITMYLTLCLLSGVTLVMSSGLTALEAFVRKLNPERIRQWRNWPRRSLVGSAFIGIFTLFWVYAFPVETSSPEDIGIEYPAAVQVYFQVKKDYPALDWTLVSPVEQYQEALGYGYHYELWQFDKNFTLADASNPKFDLPIPTTYIFIYVEKVPLRIWRNNDLVTTQQEFIGETEIYYRDPEGRAKLEKSVWEWCEAYMKAHDNMTVFYEDNELKVYKVEHDPQKWIEK